jgi:hypothetical protein
MKTLLRNRELSALLAILALFAGWWRSTRPISACKFWR